MIQTRTATANNHVGLCSTCNNAATCFHFARRGAALFCEMFDDHMDTAAIYIREHQDLGQKLIPTSLEFDVSSNTSRDLARLKGLCMNCEHKTTCTFSIPPEGIWHCEEYE